MSLQIHTFYLRAGDHRFQFSAETICMRRQHVFMHHHLKQEHMTPDAVFTIELITFDTMVTLKNMLTQAINNRECVDIHYYYSDPIQIATNIFIKNIKAYENTGGLSGTWSIDVTVRGQSNVQFQDALNEARAIIHV